MNADEAAQMDKLRDGLVAVVLVSVEKIESGIDPKLIARGLHDDLLSVLCVVLKDILFEGRDPDAGDARYIAQGKPFYAEMKQFVETCNKEALRRGLRIPDGVAFAHDGSIIGGMLNRRD